MHISVARVTFMHQFHRLAERAEDDRVLADVVAGPDRVHADLASWPFANLALASMPDRKVSPDVLDDLCEVQRRAAGRILFEAMMPLDDLRIEAVLLKRFRRLPYELEQHVDDE